jgi:hypothetical protein
LACAQLPLLNGAFWSGQRIHDITAQGLITVTEELAAALVACASRAAATTIAASASAKETNGVAQGSRFSMA